MSYGLPVIPASGNFGGAAVGHTMVDPGSLMCSCSCQFFSSRFTGQEGLIALFCEALRARGLNSPSIAMLTSIAGPQLCLTTLSEGQTAEFIQHCQFF